MANTHMRETIVRVMVFIAVTAGVLNAPAFSAEKSSLIQEQPSRMVFMARADWDTGWFQAEIFKRMLQELGFTVKGPETMTPDAFYPAVAAGRVDLWVNGWFPNTYFLNAQISRNVEAVGYEVKKGALQGYMIDKKTADQYGIRSLSDFQHPEIVELFDLDADGRADLLGCNPGWNCRNIIDHHIKTYNLTRTVEIISGAYSFHMAKTIKRFKRGKPVFFYTWTPHWAIGKLIPGKDVIWLEVPYPSLPREQKHLEGEILVPDVSGCPRTPCALGFPPSDIRVVANKTFLNRHPGVRLLAEQFTIDLDEIAAQNARMIDGEDDIQDIINHAHQWIKTHRDRVDQWLFTANGGKKPLKLHTAQPEAVETQPRQKFLRVVTKRLEPFVMYENQQYTGFSIDLWSKLSDITGYEYELYGVDTTAKLIDEIRRGTADIAVSGIGITSKREQTFDFSHPFYEAGLQIMLPKGYQTPAGDVFSKVIAVVFSRDLILGFALFFIILLIASHIIWFLERRKNKDFSERYFTGLWEAFWWAVVTVTTVGYGDKTPKGKSGRFFGLIWILAGYFVFAYFTATVTTTVTVQELQGSITGPEDLFGKKVATVERSPSAEYLESQGFAPVLVEDIEAAYRLLEHDHVSAIVYDAPVLQHYASTEGRGKVKVAGLTFQDQQYGFGFPHDSPIREEINVALLFLIEKGIYKEIYDKWFR